MIGHLLNRTATVYRPSSTTDEVGGQTVTLAAAGTVRIKVGQPTAEERMQGDQWGGRLTHVAHVLAGADVERGDELEVTRVAGSSARGRLRVLAVSGNSHDSYRRLELEAYEAGA